MIRKFALFIVVLLSLALSVCTAFAGPDYTELRYYAGNATIGDHDVVNVVKDSVVFHYTDKVADYAAFVRVDTDASGEQIYVVAVLSLEIGLIRNIQAPPHLGVDGVWRSDPNESCWGPVFLPDVQGTRYFYDESGAVVLTELDIYAELYFTCETGEYILNDYEGYRSA